MALVDRIKSSKVGNTNINPYMGVQCLVARSPEELCDMINAINRPIKIWSWVSVSNMHIAYFSGDVRIKRTTNRRDK